jgi:hypothetical protein
VKTPLREWLGGLLARLLLVAAIAALAMVLFARQGPAAPSPPAASPDAGASTVAPTGR